MEGNHQLDPNELERWERIDGVIYDMSPAPSTEHQRIVRSLLVEIGSYLKGKTCEVFQSPFDVYLNADEAGQYVQPDICIVCNPNKLRLNGCYGAPDMIVEVLSPRTAKKDRTAKLRAYKASGVREYWIIDPLYQLVEVYDLQGEVLFPTVYGVDETVTVGVLEKLDIVLTDIFSASEGK